MSLKTTPITRATSTELINMLLKKQLCCAGRGWNPLTYESIVVSHRLQPSINHTTDEKIQLDIYKGVEEEEEEVTIGSHRH
jgi:hypothetical protein